MSWRRPGGAGGQRDEREEVKKEKKGDERREGPGISE